MAKTDHPPYDVRSVLAVARDSLLGGSAGWLRIPAGGTLNCSWQPRKRCYRVTIDIHPGGAIAEPHKVADYVAQTAADAARLVPFLDERDADG